MNDFGKRIRLLAQKLGKEEQQLAKDLNLTKSQLSHYVNGNRKVPSELLQRIVDMYGINPVFLFKENTPLYIREVSGVTEDDYNYYPTSISAGLPSVAEPVTNYDAKKITIPSNLLGKWAGNSDLFVIKINGDSMNKIMPDGSLIAVKPTSLLDLKNGDIVVFSENHEYSVKRYFKHGDNIVFKPESYDREFYDQTYTINDDITIHGKVVLYIVELD